MVTSSVTDTTGQRNQYGRYFRRVGINQKPMVIEHNFGQIPTVELYELQPIALASNSLPKFYLYCGYDEHLALSGSIGLSGQMTLGISFQSMLTEYQVESSTDDSLNDVINDFLDAFFALPNADQIDYLPSLWIDQNRDRMVKDLQAGGEWDDIYWFMLPKKTGTSGRMLALVEDVWELGPQITLHHLSNDSLMVAAVNDSSQSHSQPDPFIDLMIVLRI